MLVDRGDDGDVGDAAIGDRPFCAGQPTANNPGMDRGRFGIAAAFGQCKAADQRSVRQFWQKVVALRVGSGGQDRFRRQIGGGSERDRRHRSAHFFGQDTEAFVAEAGAAKFLGEAAPIQPISAISFHRPAA